MIKIAHRGDISSHPENTLAAFAAAFDRGADGVEMDVQLINDRVVIVHDIVRKDSSDLPLLSNILPYITKRGRIEIEIKAYDTGILKPLAAIINLYSKADIDFTTSEIPLAIHIKNQFPFHRLGLILKNSLIEAWMTEEIVFKKLIGWGEMSCADRLHIPFQIAQQFGGSKLVDRLHREAFTVHIHIPQSTDQAVWFETIKAWGVDQCTVDDISLFLPLQAP
jgi:glycerophosphoryl diester phosphodiesterase